jgi:hypothetical protein
MDIYKKTCTIIIVLIAFLYSGSSFSAEKGKKPYPRYWMRVETNNMSMPGMQAEMPDIPGLSGMLGGFGKAKRSLYLQLNSPYKASSDPQATHDIPPVMKMGDTLPLLTPPKGKPGTSEGSEGYEKPKFRMLVYWGCSEKVRQGQPKVIDTDKMTIEEFGRAMAGRAPSPQYPPTPRSGWIYSEWPNIKKKIDVQKDSSLIGEHVIHGNYLPDTIRFKIDERHDFMAPVEFTSVKGDHSRGFQFAWKSIPTATGYFATAISHNEKTGEMILWTSSEVYDTGWGLMHYLSNDDVRRFIKEKVIMPADTTSCAVPGGIFKDARGVAVQFIAYGDELNLVHPPRPDNPKEREKWNPVWTVKVRLKSTGMVVLDEMEQDDTSRRSKKERSKEDESEIESGSKTKDKDKTKDEEGSSPLKKLKGIFGF